MSPGQGGSVARLGNVTGAVLCGAASDPERVGERVALLEGVVERVETIRGDSRGEAFARALAVCTEERMLVAFGDGDTAPTLEELVALCAWPETSVLVWARDGRTGAVLAGMSSLQGRSVPGGDLEAWLVEEGAERLDACGLGLRDGGDSVAEAR